MRKENASFVTKFISESGSYLINADYFAFVELKDYACYVIADGIDMDDKKESAKLATTTIISKFSDSPGMSAGKMKQYMKAAHLALLEEANEIRLEASIVVVLTDYKKVMWAHVGNCRLYWMRNGVIKAATKDTSLSQKMADQEEVPIDQLAYHEERNNLYAYLGQPGRFTPVISSKKLLEDGDILVMQTRGVWENVGEAELIDATDGVSKAEDVCTGLEDVILSQRLEIIENYTIATIFIDKVYNNPKAGKYKKWIKIGVSVGVAVVALAMGIGLMRYQTNKNNLAKMDKYKVKGIEYLQENNYVSAEEEFAEAYEAAENVKISEKSKDYKRIECTERYDKMAENLKLATEAMKEKEYKKANSLYQDAITIATELKEDYKEDTSVYIEGIKQYQVFADNMVKGHDAFESGDYETAIVSFTVAAEQMDSLNDTTNRNVAEEELNHTNAQKVILEGIAFEEEGEKLIEKSSYTQALTQYESAREMYQLAKENYGSSDAVDKIARVDIKINNIQDTIEKLSNQDLEKEADEYMNKASQAARNGNYEEAQKYYEEAKAIFQETQNDSQIIAINEKIESLQQDPDRDTALSLLIRGLEALSTGDSNTAIGYLQQAREAYAQINDELRASEIQIIISNLYLQQGGVG